MKLTESQHCLNCGHGFVVMLGIGKSTDTYCKVELMEEVVMWHWSEVAKSQSDNYLEWGSTVWDKVARSPYSSISCVSEEVL